jgi:hypothetical protein
MSDEPRQFNDLLRDDYKARRAQVTELEDRLSRRDETETTNTEEDDDGRAAT